MAHFHQLESRRLPVLVVDDEPLMIGLVTRLLRALEFEVIDTVDNALEAIDLVRRKQHRLIISDYQMEPMTGLDLLQSVRSDWNLRQTCFLMMAAGTEMQIVAAAARSGLDGYLLKPFTLSKLGLKLDEVLGRRRWDPGLQITDSPDEPSVPERGP